MGAGDFDSAFVAFNKEPLDFIRLEFARFPLLIGFREQLNRVAADTFTVKDRIEDPTGYGHMCAN